MPKLIEIASDWYVKLSDADCTDIDRADFEVWKNASVEHLNAWNRIRQVHSPFEGLEPSVSKEVLLNTDAFSISRRNLLKNLGIVAISTSTGLIAYKQKPWESMLADYNTGQGEIKTIDLPDQTMVVLNTDTAIDILYSTESRTVKLIKGEILVETGHGQGFTAPFRIQTKYGVITALGTRFSVRKHDDHVSVNVYKDSVLITIFANESFQKELYENHTTTFNDKTAPEIKPLKFGTDLWAKGILSVVDLPLNEFLVELDRYYIGVIRCDPLIANLAVSGSFPLNDINAIFDSLKNTHPIRIDTVTKYWVTFKPV